MGKQTYLNKHKNNSGFTLLEVLISILILSIIITSATSAFVYASRVSRENKLRLAAMNLANKAVEYIRSLKFADVGTKIIVGGVVIYGDPSGDILQTRTEEIDGVEYSINTIINWEEQGGWDLGDTDWDYKSVKVSVAPTGMEGDSGLTRIIETYVTRDSTQPALTGANISLRLIRGWNTVPGIKVPVVNAKVSLTAGPSAPRQVQTSSAGVARFINLVTGNYTVRVNPDGLGMILHPDQVGDWILSLAGAVTQTKEFEAEYPCSIKLALKDLNGDPIKMDTSVTGAVKVSVPYGTEINKIFTSEDIDFMGCLPQELITGLWPVGDGYTGAYTIAEVSIDQCQFLGSYEMTEAGETLWSGKFDGPGTNKDISCYFVTIPETPSGISTSWVEAGSEIISGYGPYTSYDEKGLNLVAGEFYTGDPNESIVMPGNTTTDFNASAIYFENTGTEHNLGLIIESGSNLKLHAGQVVFRGTTTLQDAGIPSNGGIITLHTTLSDGTTVSYIEGSMIGGTAGVLYGKLYLAKPLVVNGAIILEPGGYYFYDGLVLPDNASELIPITKENYIY